MNVLRYVTYAAPIRYMNQDSCKRAFLESFDEYNDAIFRFCVAKTSNRELAEDLTQETFMRYWQSLRDGREMSNTKSFLYTVARNLVIDWYRKHKSDSLDTKLDGGLQLADGDAQSPESKAIYQEVLRAVHELPEADADVLVLRFVNGLEPRDIADITGERANTVSVRISRAVQRLQERIDPTS